MGQLEAQLILGGAASKEKVHGLLRGDRREQRGLKELRQCRFEQVIETVSRLKGEAWQTYRAFLSNSTIFGFWLRARRLGFPITGCFPKRASVRVRKSSRSSLCAPLANVWRRLWSMGASSMGFEFD